MTQRAADPLAFLDDEVAALRERHLYRQLRVMSSAQGPIVSIDDRRLISLSSNDYLGPDPPPAGARGRRSRPSASSGRGAARSARSPARWRCTRRSRPSWPAFKDVPAVLTFQSGFTANTGVIPTITGETDLIVSDALNHASIIDGMRLSKAPRKVYPHADVEALREILARGARERPAGRRGVAADPGRDRRRVLDGWRHRATPRDRRGGRGVRGGRDGRRRPRQRASSGRNGRGSVDHFGLHGRVAIQVGTLSKAVGSLGGYVAGSQALREILTQRARPFLFSTSHPPAVVAACREAIRVMQDEPELQERLWANTRSFKAELTRLGFDTGRSETPITPVMMGDPDTAGRFSDRLIEEGVFAQPVVFPTVAIDKSRLRTIVTAAHADEQLETALAAFDRVGHELGLIAG